MRIRDAATIGGDKNPGAGQQTRARKAERAAEGRGQSPLLGDVNIPPSPCFLGAETGNTGLSILFKAKDSNWKD